MDEFDKLAGKIEELEARVFVIYNELTDESSVKTLFSCVHIYQRLKKLVEALKMYHVEELLIGKPVKYKKLHKNTSKRVSVLENMIENLEKGRESDEKP